MAIDALDLALRTLPPPIYVYHEIVHKQARRGALPRAGRGVCGLAREAPRPRAFLRTASRARRCFSPPHGVSPEIRRLARERGLRAIDATCPLVTKVHLETIKYAELGYTILLIGHEGARRGGGHHGRGARGRSGLWRPWKTPTRSAVPDASRVAYLTQTTLSVDDANRIVGRLRESGSRTSPPRRRRTFATPPRTARRRSASLCGEADVTLVLGSQNSSNSQRLAELSAERGVPAYLIDGPGGHRPRVAGEGAQTVLVTAGAERPGGGRRGGARPPARALRRGEVEARTLRTEDVSFPLPRELREGRQVARSPGPCSC